MSVENVKIVQHAMQALAQSLDPAVLVAATAENVVIKAVIAEGTPLSGEFRGREGFARYFRAWGEVMDMLDLRDVEYVASGDKVVMLGVEKFRVKRTGTIVECEIATVFTVREGKIVKVVGFAEMSAIVDAYRAAAG